jgi:hypothetical protein
MIKMDDDESGSRIPENINEWLALVRQPWSPVAAAERQLEALAPQSEGAPSKAAYEHLLELAIGALQWLEEHPCPDKQVGRTLAANIAAYKALADAGLQKLGGQHQPPVGMK